MITRPKIDAKKVKPEDADSAFNAIADGYGEWMKELRQFNKLLPAEQKEFLEVFGKDMNALLLILFEFSNPRTDDVNDRGNQI